MPKLLALNVVHVLPIVLLCLLSHTAHAQQEASETISFGGRPLQIVAGRLHVRMVSKRTADEVNRVLPDGFTVAQQFLPPERTEFFSSRAIIAPEPGMTMNAARVAQRNELRDAEDRLTRTFTIAFTGPRNVPSAIAYLRKVIPEEIEIVEPWTIDQLHARANDPALSQQDYLQTIGFNATWEIFKGSDSVVIGISDDGCYQDHEDLKDNIAANRAEVPDNKIDDDANGYVDDFRGYDFAFSGGSTPPRTAFDHGTRVAGLAAASTDNGKGIASAGMKSRFFPIGAAGATGGIQFGYLSLIYAAERGFPVVNASWGVVKPASAIDQSVIDFCLAKNVLVVASAGNHGSDVPGAAYNRRNYPSSYEGVLGVGETTPDDFVIGSSGLAGNSYVMAPGNLAISTYSGDRPEGDYTSTGTAGTSFAAPIVAGAAGVVRARWPQLTARQVAAHLRRTAIDITSVNPGVSQYVAPRLSMFRAVTIEPLSQPSMRIASVRQTVSSGPLPTRFRVGDTLYLEFEIANDLGPAWVEIEPRILTANGWDLQALRERDNLGTIATAGTARSKQFPFVVKAIGSEACLMRVEFLGETYQDYAFHYLNLPAPISRFENDSLLYSMSDDGMVGYNSVASTRQGSGFVNKPVYQLMSPGGFFLVDGGDRSVTGFRNDPPYTSDFIASKPFEVEPQPASCRMVDAAAAAQIGVEVVQTCSFPFKDKSITVWNVSITPRSAPLPSVAAGYLLDWDITTGGRDNTIKPLAEALPATMRTPNAAAQVIYKESTRGGICVAVLSDDAEDRAQSVGVLLNTIIDDSDGFTHRDRVQLLSGGASFNEAVGDICGVVGMRRTKPLEVGQTWSFKVVIASASNWGPASDLLREFLSPVSVSQENVVQIEALVIPNPVTDIATVRASGTEGRCTVFDVFGRERISWFHSGEGQVTFDASTLEKGAYTLRIEDARSRQFRHLRFVR